MNVLSLFDGMSCGRIALDRAGIKVDNYFASEIDKYAISVSKHNYPDIKHIGDVTQVKASDLPKIDLIIGGSPCQGFSFAGKQLNFNDPRSVLFFEFVRILKEIREYNPNVLFLLENVKMKKEYQDVISEQMGVEPIKINSALVSAQNRERLYWSNITVSPLADKGILLKHIVEDGFVDRDKSLALTTRIAGATLDRYVSKSHHQIVFLGNVNPSGKGMNGNVYGIDGKSPTLTTREPKIAVDGKHWRKLTPLECERLQTVPDNYSATVSNSQRYKMLGNGWTVDVIAEAFFKHLDLY